MSNTKIQDSRSGWLDWVGLVSLIACGALLGVYLVTYHGVGAAVGFKTVLAVYFLCFVPGYLVQRYVFGLRNLPRFEQMLSSLLLGVFLTPIVWYLCCWLEISTVFFPLIVAIGVSVPWVCGWFRGTLWSTDGANKLGAPGDAAILWLALGMAVLWSYSMSVVELRDSQAFIMPFGDHAFHVSLIAELGRGVPAQTLPFVAGAERFSYHEMPDVWCEMMRRATGADLQTAYFYLALTLRYVFMSIAIYLGLVRRFGRPAALMGVCFTLAVVGHVSLPSRDVMFSNSLLFYLHCSYPTAFGLTAVFLILYYVSLLKLQEPRPLLLLASVLSVVLLWYKANFAMVLAPAVAVLSLMVLRRQKDYRWWWVCVGTQALLTSIRVWQLSHADFAQVMTIRPLAFLIWWWDLLAVPSGWPTATLQAIRVTVEGWPSVLQWPVVLAVCLIHRFHIGLLAGVYLLVRLRRKTHEERGNLADSLTLLILVCTIAGFVLFPVAEGMVWNVSLSLWALVCAILFSLVGVMVYGGIVRALHGTRFVAFGCIVIVLLASIGNAYGLRMRAVWQTRYRSDVITEDVFECYRFIRNNTEPEAMILQPEPEGTATAGMLTQRRIVLDYDHSWSVNFFNTRPILADIKHFYRGSDDASKFLRRYGVDYVVADLSEESMRPPATFLIPIFQRGSAVVFRIDKGKLRARQRTAVPPTDDVQDGIVRVNGVSNAAGSERG